MQVTRVIYMMKLVHHIGCGVWVRWIVYEKTIPFLLCQPFCSYWIIVLVKLVEHGDESFFVCLTGFKTGKSEVIIRDKFT